MTCVTTVQFSVMVNGSLEGYFNGKKGLRQGDPLSPYLFVLGMEYLSRLLAGLEEERNFQYHPKCHRIKLTHPSFADDLMLFCKGNEGSIQCLIRC